MSDAAESWVKTLRERTHRLTTVTATLELQTQLLGKKVDELFAEVRRIATADEIAQGVADELRRRAQTDREKTDSRMQRTVWVVGVGVSLVQALFHFL